MSQMGKTVIKLVALMFAAAVMVGIIADVVEATPGNVLETVNIPSAALCSGSSGTALAVVSGGKAGYPEIPVLLVTSGLGAAAPLPPSPPQGCGSGTSVNLVFIDPLNPAFVRTLTTTVFLPNTTNKPDSGWKALALRVDSGDLLACGTKGNKTVLWSVDFSPFNTTSDGTATFLRIGAGSSCNAIAWDATDKTTPIFQAVGTNVHHMTGTGTDTPSMPISGCTASISGLSVAGTSLFVGCANKIQQVNKATGTVVRTFTGVSVNPVRGLPDDPTTWATDYKEQLWVLNTSPNQLVGVEIPGGTIGQLTGVPVLFPGVGSPPNACPTGTQDTDRDGLLDCWENGTLWNDGWPGISYEGIYDGNIANRDVQLCVPVKSFNRIDNSLDSDCADRLLKDLFVEIDYMTSHRPDEMNVIKPVKDLFANAPTSPGPGPVRLHVLLDDEITHNNTTANNTIAFVPCTAPAAAGAADFDDLKKQYFGTAAERALLTPPPTKQHVRNAKALAFRYGMFVHNLQGSTTSGCAEIGGNDFVVSLGSFTSVLLPDGSNHNSGTIDQQKGTLAHEFGHTLGLRHGGGDNINCKPNYASVMNYSLQFDTTVPNRPLGYSSQILGDNLVGGVIGLDKSSLIENDGVVGDPPINFTGSVAFGPVVCSFNGCTKPTVVVASGAIDWSNDLDTTDTLPSDITFMTSSSGGCPANQKDAEGRVVQILKGFHDWANIQFNFHGSLDFGGGEQTFETVAALSRDVIDIKPNDRNNTINSNSSQTIAVAIFGRPPSDVDPGLDVTTIVQDNTLILKGTGGATWVVPVNTNANACTTKDVDKDGQLELLCNFTIPAGTVSPSETRAALEGITTGGQRVLGLDFIRVQ